LDESEGKTIAIDGQPAVAGRFISHGEQQKLHELISQEKPKVAVEIGLANGYSTLSLLQGLSDKKCGTLISIDPFQLVDFRGAALMNIRRAGLDGFHFWWGKSSLIALPALLESESKIDFAFVDGNHLFDYTLIEFAYLDKLLRKNGLLVFHDYNYPSVRACLNYIEKNYAYTVEGREGSLRILRKREDDQRPWYFFKPFDVPQIEWTTLEGRGFCE
ncbi:hypothetical protein AYO49_06340, partial [Verrucomicrobiaceae bacterium SCGC AG-212-N21]